MRRMLGGGFSGMSIPTRMFRVCKCLPLDVTLDVHQARTLRRALSFCPRRDQHLPGGLPGGAGNVYTPYAVLIQDQSNFPREIGDPSDDLNLAAQEVVRLAYFEDPYFHPSLRHRVATPTLPPAI